MTYEFRSNFLKSKLKQHQKISFVYYCDAGFLCVHHLNQTFMNKGALKQHLRGKAHKIDFETGEPIVSSGIHKEILMHLESINKVEAKPSSDKFWELNSKLDVMFPGNHEAKNYLLSHHGFDDMIKYDIQNQIKVQKDIETLKKFFKANGYDPDKQ